MFRALRTSLWPRIPTLKIRSVNRLTLDRELRRQFQRLGPGVVLDVGAKAAPYAAYVRAERYVRLDIDPKSRPAWTGVQRILDTGGQVAKFNKKFAGIGSRKK